MGSPKGRGHVYTRMADSFCCMQKLTLHYKAIIPQFQKDREIHNRTVKTGKEKKDMDKKIKSKIKIHVIKTHRIAC